MGIFNDIQRRPLGGGRGGGYENKGHHIIEISYQVNMVNRSHIRNDNTRYHYHFQLIQNGHLWKKLVGGFNESVEDTIILNIFQVIASLCYVVAPDQRQAIT